MKRICLMLLLTSITMNLFCQVHWTKYADNPIMEQGAPGEWDSVSVGPGSIIFYDNTYHMYYDGFGTGWGIGLAVSQDGINWERNEKNPLLVLGAPGEWDAYRMSDAFVVKADTLFHMWYSACADDADIWRIGHATSPDGIEWTKDPDNPVKDILEGLDSTSYTMHAPVMFDGSLYHIYYSTGKWGGGSKMEIWHATSLDGYQWTKDPLNPVLKGQFIYVTCVIYDGEKYIMWYGDGGYWAWDIYLAFSDDGSNWEKYENNPVLTKGPSGSWDGGCPTRAIVVFDSTEYKYKMWYAAVMKYPSPETIGYAVSDTCSDHNIPVIQCDSTIIRWSEYIEVKSSEDGVIYLIPFSLSQDLRKIREYCIDSVVVVANVTASFNLSELANGVYTIYARDKVKNVSSYYRFRLNIKLGVGINDNYSKLPINIFPNPANNEINIKTVLTEKYTIEITTINGQMIYNTIMEDSEIEIDISTLASGMYFVTIKSKNNLRTQKFIKQ